MNVKECKIHGQTEFTKELNGHERCKKCRNEAVYKRRKNLKVMAVQYKGGKCILCGYSKCVDAMEFHNRNPEEKDFGIGHKGLTRSWESIKKELDKCDLLCANCHAELHYNLNRSK